MHPTLPPRQELTVAFAHAAYRLGEEFASRAPDIKQFEVRSLAELEGRVSEADVLVVSGLWRNTLLEKAGRLRLIQSISAGTDQYDRALIGARGVRLASAQGANERAVAEHAMALILAFARQLHLGRDNQRARAWRGMIGDRAAREDELAGKTLVIVGLGRIGLRLARIAGAFDMRVVGVRRTAGAQEGVAEIIAPGRLADALPRADYVALTCPLTPQTRGLIGAAALAAMKPSAVLINVARGGVVDEAALLAVLEARRIAGAALDCFAEEPLPDASPFWGLDNVLVTPHTAGETSRYETNVVDLLMDNLDRLWRGEAKLKNEIV